MIEHVAPLRLALMRDPTLPQAGEERSSLSSPACGRGGIAKAMTERGHGHTVLKMVMISFGLASATSMTGLSSSAWAEKATIRIGQPDCTECAVDIFSADLSGKWSEFCSIAKQAEYVLRFEHKADKYLVSTGGHSCELTDVVDYSRMERRHVVQSVNDCTVGAPNYLIAEYRLAEDNHLELTALNKKKRLIDCVAEEQTNAPR